MIILGLALTVIGYAAFIWVARQLQKSPIDRSPYIGPFWSIIAIATMIVGLVIVFLQSVLTGIVLIAAIIAVRCIVAIAGSRKSTRHVMHASYESFRKSLVESGQPNAEIEALYHCLKSRPPFNAVGEDVIRAIVEKHPNIEELTEYVLQYDAWEASKKAEAFRNAQG